MIYLSYLWPNGLSHAVFIPSSLTEFKARLTELENDLGDMKAGVTTLEAADHSCFISWNEQT